MVDGAAIVERPYFDPVTKKDIRVQMSIRDHILFQLLQKIADGVAKRGR